MKVCLVHNEYSKKSGEEKVVVESRHLLKQYYHEVVSYYRSSAELENMTLGNFRAFFSGIYSLSSRRTMHILLQNERPDLVHIHNLYPLISPSVLSICTRFGVPIVMTAHNYRLICPSGLFMTHGELCERCAGGREYWCVLCNCEKSLFKSLGYALRSSFARVFRLYKDNVTMYVALTEFQKKKLVTEGFPAERIAILPNMAVREDTSDNKSIGEYVGYIGRISPEKGIHSLLSIANKYQEIPFKAAGGYDRMPELPNQAPSNFEFLGHLAGKRGAEFYSNSRMIVLCSTSYEGFPMVLAEAMFHGKPLICSRIGGLPEIVEDGKTGLLFEPGNAEDLASKIRYLWDRPDLCREMGIGGRKKALREYSPEKYYKRLMEIYRKAIELQTKRAN